jgi:ribose transport system permease protein
MKLKSLGILGLFLVLMLFLSFMTSDPWYAFWNGTFWKPNNIENLLHRTSLYGLLGIGVAFVIITGGIDLSIGSVVCLSGCLLAMFLRVDYRPIDRAEVIRLEADSKTILIRPGPKDFSPGETVRLSDVRRARNALLEIEKVSSVTLEDASGKPAGSAVKLIVRGDVSRDDDTGTIAKAYPIQDFSERNQDKASSVSMKGSIQGLRNRDQLVLLHPKQGQKQIEVEAVRSENGETIVNSRRELGTGLSSDWFAVPLERKQRMSIPAALLSVAAIAALLGTIHGLLITRLRLQPFVVTLCGLLIYRGLSRQLVNDQAVGFGNEYSDGLSLLGSGKWTLFHWVESGQAQSFGIPYPFFIFVIVAVVAAVFLNRTIGGRYLLALGRNEEAARFSGINTKKYVSLAYIICTVSAAVAGMLFALNFNSVSPSSFGNFFELYAIAAAVLGGCSLRGGEGTIFGVVLGTAVMQMLNNMILLMKISDKLEFAIIGFVILLGVTGDELFRRMAARKRSTS